MLNPDLSVNSLSFTTLFHQSNAQLVGILQIDVVVFIAILPFVFLRKEIEVISGVVVELIGIADIEGFGIAEDVLHHFGVLIEDGRIANHLHLVLRAIHRENHSCWDNLVSECDLATEMTV